MARFQYPEKWTESLTTHLAAKDFQVSKLRKDSRQHRWFNKSILRRHLESRCTPVWNDVNTFFVFSGAHIVKDLTSPAYATSETSRVRISALRRACHLSMSAAASVNPDSSCAVPNCKQTFLNRSWLAIEDSTWGTRRRF
jgi:hypothetical protein